MNQIFIFTIENIYQKYMLTLIQLVINLLGLGTEILSRIDPVSAARVCVCPPVSVLRHCRKRTHEQTRTRELHLAPYVAHFEQCYKI